MGKSKFIASYIYNNVEIANLICLILFQINEVYANVPRVAIERFIKNCVTCSEKCVQLKKAPLKPIIQTGFLQRIQVRSILQ